MSRDTTDITPPEPEAPLPQLNHEERFCLTRSARLVKDGALYAVTFRLHPREDSLECSWSERGQGTICT